MARRRRKPKLPEPVQTLVSSLSHDGRGIARIEGKTLFIDGALPGEEVLVEYTNRKRAFDEGRAMDILTASADRTEPRCAQAALCGGCSLQHMKPAAQIAYKQQVLLEQFEHFGGIEVPEILAPLVGPDYGYRRKARLGVKYVHKKNSALVGFREKRNSFLAEIHQCHVLTPDVGLELPAFRELIAGLAGREVIPQIEVARGDDHTALIVRHLEPLVESDIEALIQFCDHHRFDLYLQPAGNDSIHKLFPEQSTTPTYERLHYQLPEFGLSFAFHPTDFTQVNADINRRMVTQALRLLDVQPQERVLDLFCGLGNFTLPLATQAESVVGVEGDEAMVVRGRENARINDLSNVEFFGADLTKPFTDQPWGQQGFDKILIDPPRSGAQEIVAKMTHFKPARIVYVSCNPATLARDAGVLREQGYELKSAGVMDMFPHTTHVESMAVFEPMRKKSW